MPLKNGRLTPQERKFATAYAACGEVTEAARRAGYSGQGAGSNALARPEVQALIKAEQQARLFSEILPMAVERHKALLADPQTNGQVLLGAIRLAYDRTLGLTDAAGVGKALHEMSADELGSALQRLEQEAAARAKPIIDAVPQSGAHSAPIFE